MNAMKFVMILLFGVVCATVDAIRPLEEESKETDLSISIPKPDTTNSVGAEFTVVIYANPLGNGNENVDANKSTKVPSGSANGYGISSASGYAIAEGLNARAYSSSNAYGQGLADAATAPNGATATGNGSGDATTVAYGSTGPQP